MTLYQNLHLRSGVAAFEISPDSIIVQFKDGLHYRYTNRSAGQRNVEHMKQLAAQGYGLNSYINSNRAVRNGYEQKWK